MDIIADILEVLESGRQSKTAIMRKANLNLKRVNSYIDFLLLKGFVSVEEKACSSKYSITKKGLELLKDYRSLKENEKKLIENLKKLESVLSFKKA